MSRDTLCDLSHFLSRTFLSAFFCLSLAPYSCNIGAQTKVWGQTSEPPIRVGALQRSDLEGLPTQQVILLDRLRRELHPRRVNMQYFSQKELSSAIAAHSLDFIICDSLSFAELQKNNELRPLAGLVYPQAVDADHMTASTVFIRRSEQTSSLTSLNSLRGKHLATLSTDSFGGFIALQAELYELGIKPTEFWNSIKQTQGSHEAVIEAVQKGAVGVLPACTLEIMASQGLIRLEDFAIIGKQASPVLKCAHSTAIYPGWLLASVSGVDMATVRTVASSALSSAAVGSLQWSFPPTDFHSIQDLLVDLRLGPYAGMGDQIIADVLYRYRWWFVSVLCFVIIILLHSFLVARQVCIRTRDLRNLMIEQKRMANEMMQTRSRLQSMEKMQTVSHMSATFAHELKQPISAIRNFALGLMRRSQRDELDAETLCAILGKVIYLTDQASDIVAHVRQYAKHGNVQRERVDLRVIAKSALETFNKSVDSHVTPKLREGTVPVWVEINCWEFELAVLNLLKNSAEALKKTPQPQITIDVLQDTYHAKLRVIDNGVGLDDELLKNIFTPFFSTKRSGMGLGLSIAMSVAERHGGRLNARRNEDGGVTMEFVLPLCSEKVSHIEAPLNS